jgi:hypothetical protein
VLLSSPSSSLFAGSWGRCVAHAVEIDLHVFFFLFTIYLSGLFSQ